MPHREGVTYPEYIRTDECYFDELAELEAERIVLEVLTQQMVENGFIYYEHTARPVVPRTRDSYVPDGYLSVDERLYVAYQRTSLEFELKDMYGRTNVWIGPQIADTPQILGLSESEQRGFWIRLSPAAFANVDSPEILLSV